MSNGIAFALRYGPWAIITGASSGIGREISKQAAARGLNLVLAARNEPALHQLAAELQTTYRIQALAAPVDLAAKDGPPTLLARTAHLEAGLLVNSAGYGSGGSFLQSDPADAAAMVDLNCRAVLELTHGFAARLVEQGRGGGIILLSSIVAFQGVPRAANYSATKAYVQSLGEALADELRPHGIDVLCAAPGPTASGFADRAGMTMNKAEPAARIAAGTLSALGRKRTVVPGIVGKILSASLATAPRFLRVQIMKNVMQSMTAGRP